MSEPIHDLYDAVELGWFGDDYDEYDPGKPFDEDDDLGDEVCECGRAAHECLRYGASYDDEVTPHGDR